MSIAFDAAVDGGFGNPVTSLTWAHTCTGANGLLLVVVVGDHPGGHDDITGVTYAGVSLTFVEKSVDSHLDSFVYLYALVGPSTGANNVVVSCTNAHALFGGSASYTGVSQTGFPDAQKVDLSGGAVATLATSLTSVADNCWMFIASGGYSVSTADPTAGTGATRRKNEGSFGLWGLFDNNAAITPAGSTTMTINRSANTNYMVNLAVTFAPPGGAPSGWGPLLGAGRNRLVVN